VPAAAKLNAQKHREADGGTMNWEHENYRHHGQMPRIEGDRDIFKEALMNEIEGKKKPTEVERATRK
jgi:hypothetical protein